jgi:ferredoxin-NADP reductase
MEHTLSILDIKQVTHDVKQFKLERPDGYTFSPGQATEVSIDKNGWRDKKRPFTFTSLPGEENLEFTIKVYTDHSGVTNELNTLDPGDRLIIRDPWGTIQYKGKGTFLAGGAGITPFISIFRDLHQKDELHGNKLIFSNKSEKDIILRDEFKNMLGDNFINVITESSQERSDRDGITFLNGFITKEYLQEVIDDFSQEFYVCGPPPFNKSIIKYLKELGAEPESIVFEN